MLRITKFISLSTGWCKKIRITLSIVALSVIIKPKSKCSVAATNQWQKI